MNIFLVVVCSHFPRIVNSKIYIMKAKPILLLALVVLLFSCQEEKKPDNPEQLKQVLTSYFDGVVAKDIAKMNAVTTDDFVLYEDGLVWNNDSLLNLVNSMPPFEASFKFDYIKINIDQEIGNISYFNHADMILNDTTEVKYDWIESATFQKIEGEWKMNFLHSTVKK